MRVNFFTTDYDLYCADASVVFILETLETGLFFIHLFHSKRERH